MIPHCCYIWEISLTGSVFFTFITTNLFAIVYCKKFVMCDFSFNQQ